MWSIVFMSLCLSSLCSGQSLGRPVQQYNNGLVNNGASVRPGILTLQYTFNDKPQTYHYTDPLSAVIFSDPASSISVPQQQFPPIITHVQPHYEHHQREHHHAHHEHHHSQLNQHHLSQSFPYQPLQTYYTYNPPRSQYTYKPQVYTTYVQPQQEFYGHHQQHNQFSSYSSY